MELPPFLCSARKVRSALRTSNFYFSFMSRYANLLLTMRTLKDFMCS